MDTRIEVIGIDHGWSMMKSVSEVFVTGIKEITTIPALYKDTLEYKGKYYRVGTNRQEVKDTKTEDDSFKLLTYAAVAKELKRRGLTESTAPSFSYSVQDTMTVIHFWLCFVRQIFKEKPEKSMI